jgi:hypothetical protein
MRDISNGWIVRYTHGAPCERVIWRVIGPYALLPIFTFMFKFAYLFLSRLIIVNNFLRRIADRKKLIWDGLPHWDRLRVGAVYGKDNQLDTYHPVIVCTNSPKQNMSAIINSKHIIMRAVWYEVMKDWWGCLSNKKMSKYLSTAKTNKYEPRDLTASIRRCNPFSMRGRSFHSMSTGLHTPATHLVNSQKGNRETKLNNKNQVLEQDLHTWLKNELINCKDIDGRYNGLIKTLSNEKFLLAAYEMIKSKPGNSTKGSTNETLDGINLDWFNKIGLELKFGKWNFKPMRMVEIPKANGKKRPLKIASPSHPSPQLRRGGKHAFGRGEKK